MRLLIKYGIYNEFIDVTKICYDKCVKNNSLFISKCVNERIILFGDPKYGKLKSIFLFIDGQMNEFKDGVKDVKLDQINKLIYLYPISFAIPEEKIINIVNKKTKILSNLIPGDLKTYIYQNEKDYYEEYQKSLFATTCKKGGWDCMRHYEIMANGCIPYFINIENCPLHTMELLPKDDLFRATQLYLKYHNRKIDELTNEENQECLHFINHLINFTKKHLTTEKMAQYILDKTENNNAKKILYLSGNTDPDYLRCLILHGFKKLLGSQFHDYPKINHVYKENIDFNSLYGKGYTYTNLLDPKLHENLYDNYIEEDIKNKKYDLIIYGSYHRGMPFYDLINQYYNKEKIILICGEDCHNCDYWQFVEKGHKVFVREL